MIMHAGTGRSAKNAKHAKKAGLEMAFSSGPLSFASFADRPFAGAAE